MTDHNLFYCFYVSFANERLSLLKVVALSFRQA